MRSKVASNIKQILKNVKKPVRRVVRPKFADERYLGPEPIENQVIENTDSSVLGSALSWYNYFYETDQMKAWLIEYMVVAQFPKETIQKVKSAPGWRSSTTAGVLAKLLLRGWTLPQHSMDFIAKRIADNAKYGQVVRSSNVINLQQRVQDRAKYLTGGLLDEHIDMFIQDPMYKFSLYDMLTVEKASPAAANMIREKVTVLLADHDIKEGFQNLSLKEQRSWIAFYKAMLLDLDRFQINKKTTRAAKPRTVKEKPAEKLVAKVKYMKEEPTLKLVSVSPHQIIKSQSLWVYNAKYRQLSVYYAATEAGLGVKGTTITNFNETTSVVKKLRKPEVTLQQVLIASKVALRRLMDDIKTTSTSAKGRLNEDSILLKVTAK
jgi:hypothetical protein